MTQELPVKPGMYTGFFGKCDRPFANALLHGGGGGGVLVPVGG